MSLLYLLSAPSLASLTAWLVVLTAERVYPRLQGRRATVLPFRKF